MANAKTKKNETSGAPTKEIENNMMAKPADDAALARRRGRTTTATNSNKIARMSSTSKLQIPDAYVRRITSDSEYSFGSGALMTLFSGTNSIMSHRCRFLLYEKEMDFQLVEVDMDGDLEDRALINPYGRVPVLLDKDAFTLYEPIAICEYIDERFPHPQLMPANPMQRAKLRQFLLVLDKDLFALGLIFERSGTPAAMLEKARKAIQVQLIRLNSLLEKQEYLLGDTFSMLDIAMAPFLWRTQSYGVDISTKSRALAVYAEKVFSRPKFGLSMTAAEKILRI